MLKRNLTLAGVLLLTAVPATISGQGRPDPAALVAAQAEAMGQLSFMDGEWRGSAWNLTPSGEKHTIIQTERVGPFLGGSVKVIEGRGYEEDGSVAFNALAIISYDLTDGQYHMRSYAQGRSGDFVVTPTDEGFTWEIPAGPMTIRYAATVRDGSWTEVGDRITPGEDPIRFFEMTLTRAGHTDWPAGAAVAPK